MVSQWFYQVMGNEVGPISGVELRNLAQRGTVSVDTLVRQAPDGPWVRADRVKGLFPILDGTPPPMPEQPSQPETPGQVFDSPQGPCDHSEKTETAPLTRPRQKWPPPEALSEMEDLLKWLPVFLKWLPVFLVACGVLASTVLFFDGLDWLTTGWYQDWLNSEAHHQGWYFIGLAFFVGPLLFGIAGILHRLNQKKGD